MTTQVEIAELFTRKLRRLARKYPSVADEVDDLIINLESDFRPGTKIAGVGYTVYKVRLPNRSAGRGKSGGFCVIYQDRSSHLVLLLLIYSKTEHSYIPNEVIRSVISSAD